MSITKVPKNFRLPQIEVTFAILPDNGVNPNLATCLPESREWIHNYTKLVCGPKMTAFMDNCNFELFASYTFPYAGPAGLRAAMDLVNILWLYDDFADTENSEGATKSIYIGERALRDPDYDDGTWISHMLQDFRRDHIEKFGPNVAHRFINNFSKCLEMLGTEVRLREKDQDLNIKRYTDLRREVSALRTAFDLVEYCLGLDLPGYVQRIQFSLVAITLPWTSFG